MLKLRTSFQKELIPNIYCCSAPLQLQDVHVSTEMSLFRIHAGEDVITLAGVKVASRLSAQDRPSQNTRNYSN